MSDPNRHDDHDPTVAGAGGSAGGGDPTFDSLAAEAAAQHAAWNHTAAVYAAETAVRRARQDERIAQQTAAYRRVAAARGQLTRAQKDGSADRIADAAQRLRQREAEAEDISDAVIEESHQLTRAGLDGLGELLDGMTRTGQADAAVLDALEGGRRQDSQRRHHNQNDQQNDGRGEDQNGDGPQ